MSLKTALIYALILPSSCRSIPLSLCLSSPFFVPVRRTLGACCCRKRGGGKKSGLDDGASGGHHAVTHLGF